MRYVYTAILIPEDGGQYSVRFPEIPDCYTCGDDLADALYMAEDALSGWLAWQEDHGEVIPEPSRKVHVPDNCLSTLVLADTDAFREKLKAEDMQTA